ncbi:hypothetical protein Nepgr_015862 [Nepenthes gracilis]|uniref:Uncharacterized protein n=1 Tax=Nepenthes gracilis TaxID=150966 RepID=A0AAD3SPD5_NEPGR|nr:hypothetical protein Nepgr_015862 [Nepenthes gracilis]
MLLFFGYTTSLKYGKCSAVVYQKALALHGDADPGWCAVGALLAFSKEAEWSVICLESQWTGAFSVMRS